MEEVVGIGVPFVPLYSRVEPAIRDEDEPFLLPTFFLFLFFGGGGGSSAATEEATASERMSPRKVDEVQVRQAKSRADRPEEVQGQQGDRRSLRGNHSAVRSLFYL